MASDKFHTISLDHFWRMLGPYGLYQHARGIEPLLSEGYCVDDNARAVQTLLRVLPHVSDAEVQERIGDAIALCWKFVVDAQHGEKGELYNFRTSTGVWLSHDVSSDMYARVLRCCASILVQDVDSVRKEQAAAIAQRILEQYKTFLVSPRAWAEALIALPLLTPYVQNTHDAEQYCLASLMALWRKHSSTSWPWFEDSLTYANALLHHGVLHVATHAKEDTLYADIIEKSSKFLMQTTISKDSIFTPIGNASWHVRGGELPLYGQQPIEASTMLDFLLDYKASCPHAVSVAQMAAPYLWFFGKNTKGVPMADIATGACCDGLEESGPNTNCGAESLLAYLWAEARIREASPEIIEYVQSELVRLRA